VPPCLLGGQRGRLVVGSTQLAARGKEGPVAALRASSGLGLPLQFHIMYCMYCGVNAIAPWNRKRTRESIGAVRHVFLEADNDGPVVLARIAARSDLPDPSYVLHSSPNRVHVFWRVVGFSPTHVEALQKQLARELETDPAATPVTQASRLAGFLYLKPPLVVMREIHRCCNNLTMRRCRVVREWKWPMPSFSSDASLVVCLLTQCQELSRDVSADPR
jgi:hypothetical protein